MRGVPSLPVDKCNIYVNIKILDRPQVETERDRVRVRLDPVLSRDRLLYSDLRCVDQASLLCVPLSLCMCVLVWVSLS